MNFSDEFRSRIEDVEGIIYGLLPKEEGSHKILLEAMNYSVKAGGKRLRPILMYESYKLCGGVEDRKAIRYFMAAMEMIHTYSLVHDDLPAMDNDEYRRGRETTWKVYGEAMGVLAGDGLLNYAFEIALGAYKDAAFDMRIPQALQVLAGKAGIYGMIGGQTIDILTEGQRTDEETLKQIYRWKTAALIEAAMGIGAILAGASEEQVDLIEKVASDIGMAFQIQDDIMDVTSTEEELGRPVGSDEKNQKTTYVTLYGVDGSSKIVEEYMDRAISNIKLLEAQYPNYDPEFLNELLVWLVHRTR